VARPKGTIGALVHLDTRHVRYLWRWSGVGLALPWRQPAALLAFGVDRRRAPFARCRGRVRDMKHATRQSRTILATIARSAARSPLFWWMVDHHDDIIAAVAGQRMRWAAFCAEATRMGLPDTRGRPVTERNARETWWQARRMVSQAKLLRAAATPPAPQPLARIVPERQAPLVPPPPTRPAASPATAGAPAMPAGSHILGRDDCLSPEEAQAVLDEVAAKLAAADRRKFPFGV
jgi:hypothetical protein